MRENAARMHTWAQPGHNIKVLPGCSDQASGKSREYHRLMRWLMVMEAILLSLTVGIILVLLFVFR